MNNAPRYDDLVPMGRSGKALDVDRLMDVLKVHDDLLTTKMVDYALGMVETREGIRRIRHYLFNGVRIQRNYAALYFKRKGEQDVLEDAVIEGKIDLEQAYAK